MVGSRDWQGHQRGRKPKLIAARVLEYLEGDGRKPVELQTAHYIDRYGVWAVMGRPLFLNEMQEIAIAENVESAYRSRQQSGDWAEWSSRNPAMAELLSRHG